MTMILYAICVHYVIDLSSFIDVAARAASGKVLHQFSTMFELFIQYQLNALARDLVSSPQVFIIILANTGLLIKYLSSINLALSKYYALVLYSIIIIIISAKYSTVAFCHFSREPYARPCRDKKDKCQRILKTVQDTNLKRTC